VVLNGATIGKGCLVGAGAVVTEGKEFPDHSLILGAPAKVVRTLTEDDLLRLQGNAASYIERGKRFRAELKKIG
jgi:carbonic anhydrase/acetyltransferase-like protein (isoleucine patch superfamily)